jgi:hypothetical protein
MTLSAYLATRDPQRDSLQPDPETEPDLYVDLDDLVTKAMGRMAARAPKLVLVGDYGTGKTHLLHVLKDRLDKDRFTPVYVKLEAHGRFAESRHLHDSMLVQLETHGLLRECILGASDPLDPDLRIALDKLRSNTSDPVARAWLLGRGPTPTQSRNAGFTTRLSDFARGVKYAEIWRALAIGYTKSTGKELLFLLDESETFQEVVDATRAADMGIAVREMFDAGNKAYGVIMGLTAPKARGGTLNLHPLGRPDVLSRVQDAIIQLRPIETVDRLVVFLAELLSRLLVDRRRFLPDDALRRLAERGHDLAPRIGPALPRKPVQREYVKMLNRLAVDAAREEWALPASVEQIDKWVPSWG